MEKQIKVKTIKVTITGDSDLIMRNWWIVKDTSLIRQKELEKWLKKQK